MRRYKSTHIKQLWGEILKRRGHSHSSTIRNMRVELTLEKSPNCGQVDIWFVLKSDCRSRGFITYGAMPRISWHTLGHQRLAGGHHLLCPLLHLRRLLVQKLLLQGQSSFVHAVFAKGIATNTILCSHQHTKQKPPGACIRAVGQKRRYFHSGYVIMCLLFTCLS